MGRHSLSQRMRLVQFSPRKQRLRNGLSGAWQIPYIRGMTQVPPSAIAPDLLLIEQLAHEAASILPPAFRAAATAVRLRIEEVAPQDILDAMDINDPFELTGLYDGIPLTEKSATEPQLHPDTIWLFRRAILDEWVDRGNVSLAELVAHVFVHELAHHFGWTDEEIAAIDPWWE